MGSTEILIYVAVASLGLGFLLCWLAFVIPAQLEIEALRIRNVARGIQKVRDDMDALEYRAELRKAVHKGTPYISPAATELENVLAQIAPPHLIDNDRWSRKATDLRSVS